MLNLSISSSLLSDTIFFLDDEHAYRDIPMSKEGLDQSSYGEDGKTLNAYTLGAAAGGPKAKRIRKNEEYYQLDISCSIFSLIRALDEYNDCRLFFYWQGSQRGSVYYFHIVMYSISMELYNEFSSKIADWISSYSKVLSQNVFSEPKQVQTAKPPSQFKLDRQRLMDYDITNFGKRSVITDQINWDTQWPVFAGNVPEYATLIITTIVAIPAVLSFFGFGSPEQRALRREKALIENSRRKILRRYKDIGGVHNPVIGDYETNNEYNRMYTFKEYENNRIVGFIYVRLKRKQHCFLIRFVNRFKYSLQRNKFR